jgi:sugar lactone lactonase YvrE
MRRPGFWLKAAWLLLAMQASAALAQKAVDLPGDQLFPESTAVTADGTAYVGSLSGGVLKVDLKSGTVKPWIRPGAFGSASTFGILDDPVNRLIWACSNDLTAQGIAFPDAGKASTIKGFDVRTGEGKISLSLPANGFCNDAAVAKDGTLYVTDSNRSHILRWTPGATALEDWFFDPALADPAHAGSGLDGIAVGPDGSLYANNWRLNILARVRVGADGKPAGMTLLQTSRPLATPDALRPLGGNRFVQAEGSGKVAVLAISGDRAEVTTLAEGLGQTTGIGAWGGYAWHVEGETSYVFGGQLGKKSPPLPFRISPVKLP